MPATITVTTDKDAYVEGDPITVTVATTPPDAAKVGTYIVRAEWFVDGVRQRAEKTVTVNFGVPATTTPTVEVVNTSTSVPPIPVSESSPGVFTGTIPVD